MGIVDGILRSVMSFIGTADASAKLEKIANSRCMIFILFRAEVKHVTATARANNSLQWPNASTHFRKHTRHKA